MPHVTLTNFKIGILKWGANIPKTYLTYLTNLKFVTLINQSARSKETNKQDWKDVGPVHVIP